MDVIDDQATVCLHVALQRVCVFRQTGGGCCGYVKAETPKGVREWSGA